MAEPLKHFFGPRTVGRIARMIEAAWPEFPAARFTRAALADHESLSLTGRAQQVAEALRATLPPQFPEAIAILVKSLDHVPPGPKEGGSMASFLYMPHVTFVAKYGLDHFEESMQAQYVLTQCFTAEFSIRAFLEKYPQETLKRLQSWAKDENQHVRRLVSEGTRPRLPWAPRLREFQKDPRPVLQLLELLKDDPELYVRRSVANNLNDIGKDHPDVLVATAKRWLKNATPERKWIVRHALRSAVKRAEKGALEALGYGDSAEVAIRKRKVTPDRASLGGHVEITFEIANTSARVQRVMADLRVFFMKANGRAMPKVFKLKALEFAPGEVALVRKKVSLANLTTRKHYPGLHRVDVVLNGVPRSLGKFELVAKR
jgi:3-methyladenine DNA glycosylase AlkC